MVYILLTYTQPCQGCSRIDWLWLKPRRAMWIWDTHTHKHAHTFWGNHQKGLISKAVLVLCNMMWYVDLAGNVLFQIEIESMGLSVSSQNTDVIASLETWTIICENVVKGQRALQTWDNYCKNKTSRSIDTSFYFLPCQNYIS